MFPEELTAIKFWINWRWVERGTSWDKVPTGLSGYNIDPLDPENWIDYDRALAYAQTYGQSHGVGLGLVVSDLHAYSCVDQDWAGKNRDPSNPTHVDEFNQIVAYQQMWFDKFDSWSEISPSGSGRHIWIKGKIPVGYKSRNSGMEFYSRDRFMTMTGSVIDGSKPIRFAQSLVDELAIEFGQAKDFITQARVQFTAEPTLDDNAVLKHASEDARSSEQFIRLWNGDISGYPSGSEADQALANYIGAWSENYEQIKRLFKLSKHYELREKLHTREDLVDRVVSKSLDLKGPPIDLSAIAAQIRTTLEPTLETIPEPTFDMRPPGLLGMVCDFIYENAARPIRQVALAGALGLLSGVCGRCFEYQGNGLNHYVVVILHTGAGKDAMIAGVRQLIGLVAETYPSATQFMGPEHIASAPALGKFISSKGNESFVSYMPEIAHVIGTLSDSRDKHAKDMLRMLLNVYNKADPNGRLDASVYSQKENNTDSVKRPAFSFMADATPGTFFEALTPDSYETGLVSRLTLLPFEGQRPALNPNRGRSVPSDMLKSQLVALIQRAQTLNQQTEQVSVGHDLHALAFFTEFAEFVDNEYNKSKSEPERAIWSRVHQKSLKLAGLCAVGVNPYHPIVTLEIAQWAKGFAINDVSLLISRIRSGEAGSDSTHIDRRNSLMSAIKAFISGRAKWDKDLKRLNAIPKSGLQTMLYSRACFRKAPEGAGRAIDSTIKDLIDGGVIKEVSKIELAAIGKSLVAFAVTDAEAISSAEDRKQGV